MEFLNKLGKKASETYQVTKEKAVNLSEELKLRGKISEYKEEIVKNYKDIGEIVYNEIKNNNDVSKEAVTSKCEEIDKANDEISKLEVQLLALKKVKKCINCGAELDIDAEFCSKCGNKQPVVEKVEVKEEPSDTKEAEVVEVNNVEENKEENKQAEDEGKNN